MEIKLTQTLTVSEEFADALSELADLFETDEAFSMACFAICNHEYEFWSGSTYINIKYKKE